MKNLFLVILVFINTNVFAQNKDELAAALFSSLQQNKYSVLQNFIPNIAALKKLSPTEFTDAKAKQFTAALKADWDKLLKEATTQKINLKSIKIIETVVKKMEQNNAMSFMSIHFTFKNDKQALAQLIVSQNGGKLYLLGIPNTTKFFINKEPQSINDEITLLKGADNENLKKEIQQNFDSLKLFISTNNINSFLQKCVYRGNNENRKWKDGINITNTNEVDAATTLYNDAKEIFENYFNSTNGTLKIDKESEGIWYVYSITCNNKEIDFAFLKINNRYYLGDIDN